MICYYGLSVHKNKSFASAVAAVAAIDGRMCTNITFVHFFSFFHIWMNTCNLCKMKLIDQTETWTAWPRLKFIMRV